MRLRTLAGVLTAAPLLAVPAAAHADEVCYEFNRVTFSNGLSTLATSGTFALTYVKARVRTDGSRYQASSGTPVTYGYRGDCVEATLSNGVRILGGLFHFEPTTSSKNGVFVPDSGNTCAFTTGSLYAVKPS